MNEKTAVLSTETIKNNFTNKKYNWNYIYLDWLKGRMVITEEISLKQKTCQ